MSQPGTDASVDPERFLRDLMAQAVTGCITAQGPSGRLRVYLMQGEVIAAHGGDDAAMVIKRLVALGALTAENARNLSAASPNASGLIQELVGRVDDALLEGRLAARFRQALLEYLRADNGATFQEMDAVFVENIQVGHDSASLLDDLTRQQGRLDTLRSRPDLVLKAGPHPANSPNHQRLLRLVGQGVRLSDLVGDSPFEELETLGFVIDMLVIESLVPEQPPAAAPGQLSAQRAEALQSFNDTDDEASGADTRDPNDASQDVASPETDAPSPRLPAPPPKSRTTAPPGLASHAGFLPSSALVDKRILSMFADHDQTRGMGEGDFSTDTELLERIDVASDVGVHAQPEPETGERVILEMEEADEAAKDSKAVSLSFGGPRLAEADARNKVAVANDVLAAVSFALDEQAGHGAGRIAIQLLLEGTPNQYAVLFQGADADKMGRVNAEVILRNLARRPESEHRQLLNLALADLIERALSSCLEELAEDAIDAMLEHIAGYQQRLGL